MEENKKLIVAALVIFFGSNAGSFINAVNPNIRSDPFTGTDGNRLEGRIEILELEVTQGQQRNAKHREEQATELATIRERTLSNKYLIERCLTITGQ